MPKNVNLFEKRADFVSASCNVIAESGFEAVTLRKVAARAGYTTGSLTHYFEDRKSLLIETLRSVHLAAADRMREAASDQASDAARLHNIVMEALPLDSVRLREWKVWIAFWGTATADPELAKENKNRYDEWRSIIEHHLGPASAARKRDARHLIALIDGIGLGIVRNADQEKALKTAQHQGKIVIRTHLKAIGMGV